MQELTYRQQEVLDFVCRFRDVHGCPPSLRETTAADGKMYSTRHYSLMPSSR